MYILALMDIFCSHY